MDKFNFEELKNFEVPESWVQGALDLQKEKKKKPFLLLHYQHVIGFAAALVIAVGVSMYLFFGSGGNSRVNIPAISPQSTTQAEQNDVAGESGTAVSSLPALDDKQSTTAQIVTEPDETDGNIGGNSAIADQQAITPTAAGTKAQAQNETKPNISGTVQEETVFEETEPCTDEPRENSTTQAPTNGGGEASVDVYFSTVASSAAAQGKVYCRLEDENGNTVGNNRRVLKYNLSEDTVRLTLIAYLKLEYGKTYTVIFCNSQGDVVKQGAVVIDGSAEYYI